MRLPTSTRKYSTMWYLSQLTGLVCRYSASWSIQCSLMRKAPVPKDDKEINVSSNFSNQAKGLFVQPKDRVRYRRGRTVSEHLITDIFQEHPLLGGICPFGAFSHAVYGKMLEDHVELDGVKMLFPKGWQPCIDAPAEVSLGGVQIKGLKFQLWENTEEKIVVIAFRGTRFTKLQDWYANFHFLNRFVPKIYDHYDRAQAYMPILEKYALEKFGTEVTLIATGHSLGGGLAQHAGYSSEMLNLVYAFNASPITGYRSVNKVKRNKNKRQLKIIRAFEHGEVLAYLRFFMRKAVSLPLTEPEIHEYRFNFMQRDGITSHSMERFARSIIRYSNSPDCDEVYS